jgi:NDP-sugar pyrophosphorylase family protein
MKAMVLAAGLGLRMRPLTLLRAKPALPVLNRPLLHWTMEKLARAGVREAVVNRHHLPETIADVLGTGKRWGLLVRYSDEPVILGTGGGPRAVRGWFGDDPLLIVNGDVLFDMDLRRLLAVHEARGARATLALRRNPVPYAYSPVVTERSGRILSIAGRPAIERIRPRRSETTGE